MKRIIVHPFLLGLYPALSLYASNADRLEAGTTLATMLAATIFAVLVWLTAFALIRRPHKSAVLASLFVLLFFCYGRILPILGNVLAATGLIGQAGFVRLTAFEPYFSLVVWSVLLTSALYLPLRLRREPYVLTAALNLMSVALTVIVLWNSLYGRVRASEVNRYIDSWTSNYAAKGKESTVQQSSGPDIYYIVLDGYARGDVLESIYQYDNSAFLSFLAQRGFFVAERSRSNYCQTALSLASSLNAIYLDDLAREVGAESQNRRPLLAMIRDNRVIQTLREHGYTIVGFSSGYSTTELRTADVQLGPAWGLNEFQIELLNSTPVPLLLHLPFLESPYDWHRERILWTLDQLPRAAQGLSPAFVFAHIVAPHPPFVFGADGQELQPKLFFTFSDGDHWTFAASSAEYVQRYRAQLAFVTRELEVAIDEILAASPEPPIIILQADHGPGALLHWNSAENSSFFERMSILNAYYLPGADYDEMYEDITPVNTFPVVLNAFLGEDYEVLEDRSYFSTWYRPYSFIEATEDAK